MRRSASQAKKAAAMPEARSRARSENRIARFCMWAHDSAASSEGQRQLHAQLRVRQIPCGHQTCAERRQALARARRQRRVRRVVIHLTDIGLQLQVVRLPEVAEYRADLADGGIVDS